MWSSFVPQTAVMWSQIVPPNRISEFRPGGDVIIPLCKKKKNRSDVVEKVEDEKDDVMISVLYFSSFSSFFFAFCILHGIMARNIKTYDTKYHGT